MDEHGVNTIEVEQRKDFRLLLALFVAFRLGSILFFRPGGYIRDYADLVLYLQRARWQEYGLLPFRDYWSEYPPIFPWLSIAINQVASTIPQWEDNRIWYALLFGLLMVVAETITFVCIYHLARKMQPAHAMRTAWLYAGLFLPVYLLGGWFDALAVMTILLALLVLTQKRTLGYALLFGLLAGFGGLIKIVPLAVLAVVPLAYGRLRMQVAAIALAIATFVAGYALMYAIGPVMTLASLRSLIDRTGWSTVYALSSGFNRLGKIVGDPFDPAAINAEYEPFVPHFWVLAIFGIVGLVLLILQYRRDKPPQSLKSLVTFAGLTYALLLLAYPAWNIQYALYLLPFIVLIFPNARGLFYALTLSALVLWEYPIHFNLIDAGFSTPVKLLIDIDYRQLLEPIVLTRTLVLMAIALDMGLTLFDRSSYARLLPVIATGLGIVIALLTLPNHGQAYQSTRLAASDLRPLVFYVNSRPPDTAVVMQDASLGRELRPFLEGNRRLTILAPGEDNPDVFAQGSEYGPFIYLQTPQDDVDILTSLEDAQICPDRKDYQGWILWFCNGFEQSTVVQFEDGLLIDAVVLPDQIDEDNRIMLVWRADKQPTRDYTVFVHLVDADDVVIGQWDQPPGGWSSSTSTWNETRIVFDDYRISAELSGRPPYRIEAGLYDPDTTDRVRILESDFSTDGEHIKFRQYSDRS